jgi:hypothetical protein
MCASSALLISTPRSACCSRSSTTVRCAGLESPELFEEIERAALAPLPGVPFEYAEWKSAKVHPDYHVEIDKTFYSAPHWLIGRRVDVRLTCRAVEIFHDHIRVAGHVRLLAALWPCHGERAHAQGPSALRQYDAGGPDQNGCAHRGQRRHPGGTDDARASASRARLPLRHGHHRLGAPL